MEFVAGITNVLTTRGASEMRELGFKVFELRWHGNTLRVVLGAREFPSVEMARAIAARLKPLLGCKYVVLDLEPLEDTWHQR